ncbi:prephenate dehydrogenase (NADP(+)) [Borealophlyctis nickersoniae]|nr:prephenate dehydrogenase (NADP(+)) [Borealophlyctis nickersoniae]
MDNDLEKETVEIGLIGLGDMGKLYARLFREAGWKKVNVCDLPSKYDQLQRELEGTGLKVLPDGFAVARRSDFIVYSVEAANVDRVVAMYGPATKLGATVCGQTSVKEPEIRAFEKYLPSDTNIVTCHSMHGPNINPKGQPLVIIRHRSDQSAFDRAVRILDSLQSNVVYLSYDEHDRITADTQAATHVAFLSMGTAWKVQSTFPWENPSYVGGIENVKILMALRIYSQKWHVYAGLAILNPSARQQVRQYAKSVSELFKLMIQEKEKEFRERIKAAADFVFGGAKREPILLSDSLLDKYSLSSIPREERKPNSHLSLLAVVDCWHVLKIHPYDHLICQTPPFRLLLGITEYLFRTPELLDASIQAALYDRAIRADDCEFYTATRGWVECIELGSMEAYQKRFSDTQAFFKERSAVGSKVSAQMIESIAQKTQH